MQRSGTHEKARKFENFNAYLLFIGIENEAGYFSFPRISETQVPFNMELPGLTEGKISLENLGIRNPLFLNFFP